MTGETNTQTDPRFEAVMEALVKARVFDVQNGKVVVNFHEGRVQSIEVTERRYQHVSKKKGLELPI